MNKINNLNKNKSHHIVISEENYSKLKSLGKFGDTFNNILSRILDICNILEKEVKR